MKFSLGLIASIHLFPGLILAEVETPVSGTWEFTETAENETTKWHYDIISDNEEMIVGVGYPAEQFDDLLSLELDGDEDLTLTFVVLQARKDGGYQGFLIEADGEGQQVSFGLEGQVKKDGKAINWTGRNQLGEEISRAEGQFQNETWKGPFQEGEWLVREVVVPQQGGWDIFWDFKFSSDESGIVGSGEKMSINNREPKVSERETVSRIKLSAPDEAGRVEGTGVEVSGDKEIKTGIMGWIAPSGAWFFLQSFEDDRAVSLIYGFAG
jgi:hypothetical protein